MPLPAAQDSQPAAPLQGAPAERVVPDDQKALAKDWEKRIKAALARVKDTFDTFEKNRHLLAGKVSKGSKETVRANLHYANLATMLPQIYAKDPEFAAQPTKAVPAQQLQSVKGFAATAEFMLHKLVVKDARLKKAAKKAVRSCSPTSIGWIKASWQEDKPKDPLIANRIKDTQDNIARLKALLAEVNDPSAVQQQETKLAELHQAMEGLKVEQEVKVAKGIALDFVMSEDVLIIDPAIRSVDDYTGAAAIAHRVWMTPEKYRETFGYESKKGRTYTEKNGAIGSTEQADKATSLLCVWEVWSQQDNRIFYVCDGEEGFCKEPMSPDWTGKRWYPFFQLAFNEIDGSFYPLSDIELTDKLVKEYNESREDFVNDRKGCLPITLIRKGGSLTDADIKNVTNAKGGDKVLVEGVGGQPVSNDIWNGQMGTLDPKNYDTQGSRYDMERILGGSDSSTGSITKAKTATEAEILSQGLRSRSAERQDALEDMLNELGPYCLEVMLRKLTLQEVQAIAGPQAVWPSMGLEDVFNQVSIEVRGGSTGKPDRLQEQDRWTKLLPIINEAVSKVAELRAQGQEAMAQAVIELVRETLRRFDERIDIEQFLPRPPQGEDDPTQMKQQVVTLTHQVQELTQRLKDAVEKVEKGFISAAATISVSANPRVAATTFTQLLGMPMPDAAALMGLDGQQPGQEQPGMPGELDPADPNLPLQAVQPPEDHAIPPQPDSAIPGP